MRNWSIFPLIVFGMSCSPGAGDDMNGDDGTGISDDDTGGESGGGNNKPTRCRAGSCPRDGGDGMNVEPDDSADVDAGDVMDIDSGDGMSVTGQEDGGEVGGGGGNNPSECRPQSIVADATAGGCTIRMVSPNFCDVVDVSRGQTYEVAWTTDGSTCETPWDVYLAGNPFNAETGANIIAYNVATNGDNITQKGAVIQIDASTFDGLTSDDGTYHWLVASFYGSHPASINFKVKK